MNDKEWGKRISHRTDISMGLVHLTKGDNELGPLSVLMKILEEKTIVGSTNKTVDGHSRGLFVGMILWYAFKMSRYILFLKTFYGSNNYIAKSQSRQ